jgi:hypothetical protein
MFEDLDRYRGVLERLAPALDLSERIAIFDDYTFSKGRKHDNLDFG